MSRVDPGGRLMEPAGPRVYRPFSQADGLDDGALIMVLRASDGAVQVIGVVREAVWEVAPDMPVPRGE